ncbi:ABC transporter permease [Rhodococcus sp. G-MC3]|uniref:ABC transporter permease n=1 Tax=Rhodococcus sp. G-MC3 TaxID=3046209 RepID=UPI0024BA68D5|nr:ABC transporter permease [Rhodococcus sp. G-MC3]MDJ0391880.1 ABC transporter permease [Rhodococcus sp. G-MC3]
MDALVKSGGNSTLRTVLAMRVTLYKRQFTGGRAAVKTIAGLLGLGCAITQCFAAASGEGNPGVTAVVLVVIGVFWLIGPVLSGISDENLHPRQFTLLPIEPTKLAHALFVSSTVGMVVPITIVAVAVLPISAATRSLAALPVALIAWPATVLLFIAASRVATLTMSGLLRTRKRRELAVLMFGTLFAGVYMLQFPILNNLDLVVDSGITWPTTFAHAVPFAWGAAGVDAAARGAWAIAAGASIALLLLDVVLLWAWKRLVIRQFDGSPVGGDGSSNVAATQRRRRRGVEDTRWRTSPTGAVVVRELSLWRGELNRRTQLVSLVVSAILSGVGPLLSASIPFTAAWGAWFVLVTAVGSGVNLYGYDGSSMWHLVMTPEAARADVRGRQIAWCVIVLPFALASVAVIRIFGDLGADRLAVPIAVTASSLGVGAGVVAWISVSAPYPVPEQKNALSMNFRGSFNGSSFLLTLAGLLVVVVAAVPALLMGLLLPGALSYLAIPVALVVSGLGFWWGGRIAGSRFEMEADRVLVSVTAR